MIYPGLHTSCFALKLACKSNPNATYLPYFVVGWNNCTHLILLKLIYLVFCAEVVEFSDRNLVSRTDTGHFPELNHSRPNCAFCALQADSATRTLILFFFCSLLFFDRSDKILTCLKTCLWNPGTYRHKIVRLSSAQFGLVIVFSEINVPQGSIEQKVFTVFLKVDAQNSDSYFGCHDVFSFF